MSTDQDDEDISPVGVPELNPLGHRIERLRLERRMSKRILASRAGTSRQQLWRVMTGKSELTSSLCARLAEVLEVDSRTLRDATFATLLATTDAAGGRPTQVGPPCVTLEEYIERPDGLVRTFETFPATADGRKLKRVLLDAIEDIAVDRSLKLPQSVFDLRREIVNENS
jgi:transcriptional regulator with XRE-family HTH domain